jgi:predicted nucleic acid-binding protein
VKYYLDTSIVVSLYVPEKHTKSISDFLIENKQQAICISRLVETEFYSVLAMKKRSNELSDSAVRSISDLFGRHLEMNSYEFAHVTDMHFHRAIEFLKLFKTNLRTLDALHLACCAEISATMVTADKELAKAAKSLSIACQFI